MSAGLLNNDLAQVVLKQPQMTITISKETAVTAQEKEALADEEMMKMLGVDGVIDDIDLSSSSISDDLLDSMSEFEIDSGVDSPVSMDEIITEEGVSQDFSSDAPNVTAEEVSPEIDAEITDISAIDEMLEQADISDEELDGLLEETALDTTAEVADTDEIATEEYATSDETLEAAEDEATNDYGSEIPTAIEAVNSLEDAINIDQGTKEIVAELQKATQEVNGMAIATAKQAQASAEQTQQAIEATFAAAEKAFHAVKNSGYVLDPESFKATFTQDELDQELATIKHKNQQLKEANELIKQRLQALKS